MGLSRNNHKSVPLYSSLSRWWKLYTYFQFALEYVWYEDLHLDNLNSRVELKSKNTQALRPRRSIAGKWYRYCVGYDTNWSENKIVTATELLPPKIKLPSRIGLFITGLIRIKVTRLKTCCKKGTLRHMSRYRNHRTVLCTTVNLHDTLNWEIIAPLQCNFFYCYT